MTTRSNFARRTAIPIFGASLALLMAGCATRSGYLAPVVYKAPPNTISRSPSTTYLETRPVESVANTSTAGGVASSTIVRGTGSSLGAPTSTPSRSLGVETPVTTAVETANTANRSEPVVTDAERVVIPLHSEQLRVGTREVESGAVRLRKVVRTETVNQPVTVRREEVVIDRLPVDGSAARTTADTATDLNQPFAEQTITIPIRREEPVVETEVVQTGQVVARKNVSSQSTTVQRPVRKEDVEVVKLGEAPRPATLANEREREGAATSTAAGSAPRYQDGSARDSSLPPLGTLAALAEASDITALVRRPVELSDVVVREVIGRGLIALEAPDGSTFYVRTQDLTTPLRKGDRINLLGRLEAVPEQLQDLRLAPELARRLQARSVYIDAREITPVDR